MFLKKNKNTFDKFKSIGNIHLIGAGGIGMSGLRRWLEVSGYNVSCSDDASWSDGFIPENQPPVGAECVVVSSAIKENHPQYVYALQNNIPVIHRSVATKYMMQGEVVSVSGAHGKTTSSGLVAHCVSESMKYVSFLIGGVLKATGESAKFVKNARLCVVEADESDGSMNIMYGKYHLLTNLAEEHLDYYKTWDNYLSAMQKFADQAEYLIGHISCKKHISHRNAIWYGNGSENYATNIRINCNGSKFNAIGPWGKWDDIEIKLPGKHFVENAIGCMIILNQLGLDETMMRSTFGTFNGVEKRMERFVIDDITIIEDYAHHPTEVGSVIDAVLEAYKDQIVHVIWEPHKFSRISHSNNFEQFLKHLNKANHILVLPLWAAGEDYNSNYSHDKIAAATNGIPVTTASDILKYIKNNVNRNHVVLAMGAGAVYKIVNKVIEQLGHV